LVQPVDSIDSQSTVDAVDRFAVYKAFGYSVDRRKGNDP